jgi:putative oxidoreductase
MNTHDASADTSDLDGMRQQTMASARHLLNDLIRLGARLSVGAVFWQSSRTKVDGFALHETAVYLFQEEYRLPLLDPTLAAGTAARAAGLGLVVRRTGGR